MTPGAEAPEWGAADVDGAESLLDEARRVLRVESRALERLADRVGSEFVDAVELLAGCSGRVIVSGVGKSGIVGRKVAATLTSTGTPASFLHPVEGLHGDLGIVGPDDVAILLSKSGETEELKALVQYLARLGVPILLLAGRTDSPLARHATLVLDCSVEEEACPMDLAPTSSSTATLAMGDALAVVLLQKKGFEPEDFARIHPGGALGRKLTIRVEEVMVGGDGEEYPRLGIDARMRDCIVPLAEMRGTVPIVEKDGTVAGVITAGDLTRLMEVRTDFLDVPVTEVMTVTPKTASLGELGSAAVHRMERHGIMALPVVDDHGRIHGIVHLHDLLRSGAA
ncbi:MAG: KpsF/GutQ family sugar-phosphate isomerase [Gemmatimonadota bacterium]